MSDQWRSSRTIDQRLLLRDQCEEHSRFIEEPGLAANTLQFIRVAEPRRDLRTVVAGLVCAQHLAPRAIRRCCRQVVAAAGEDKAVPLLGFVDEVVNEGGLADAGFTADQDKRAVAGDGVVEELAELGTLAVATVDHRTLPTPSGSPEGAGHWCRPRSRRVGCVGGECSTEDARVGRQRRRLGSCDAWLVAFTRDLSVSVEMTGAGGTSCLDRAWLAVSRKLLKATPPMVAGGVGRGG